MAALLSMLPEILGIAGPLLSFLGPHDGTGRRKRAAGRRKRAAAKKRGMGLQHMGNFPLLQRPHVFAHGGARTRVAPHVRMTQAGPMVVRGHMRAPAGSGLSHMGNFPLLQRPHAYAMGGARRRPAARKAAVKGRGILGSLFGGIPLIGPLIQKIGLGRRTRGGVRRNRRGGAAPRSPHAMLQMLQQQLHRGVQQRMPGTPMPRMMGPHRMAPAMARGLLAPAGGRRHPAPHLVRAHQAISKLGMPFTVRGHAAKGLLSPAGGLLSPAGGLFGLGLLSPAGGRRPRARAARGLLSPAGGFAGMGLLASGAKRAHRVKPHIRVTAAGLVRVKGHVRGRGAFPY